MEISTKSKNVQKTLRENLFSVPDFQRPYSWGEEQLEEFWHDVLQGDREEYFLGTIVTYISERQELFLDTQAIIDGQQRLTTIVILLAALRDAFTMEANLTDDDESKKYILTQAESTQGYIITYDDEKKEYPIVKRSEPDFFNTIQKKNNLGPSDADSASWNNAMESYRFFEAKITDRIDGSEDRTQELSNIRNLLLKCRIIVVSVDSEEDAFYIFETINARGMDLKAADLIKNLMVRNAGTSSQERKNVGDRWQKLIDEIRESDSEDDYTDKFLWQSWASRRRAVKEAELYKAIRNRLVADPPQLKEKKEAYVSYLKEIEKDAETYKHLEGRSASFPKYVSRGGKMPALAIPEVQRSIDALGLFGVSVSNSALMAVVRKYDETNILTQAQLKRVMRSIESFHFHNTMLAGSGSTGGTRGRYNRFSVELEKAASKAEVSESIERLIQGLRASLPPTSLCRDKFSSIFYAPNLKIRKGQKKLSNREFITYVLLRLGGHYNHLGAPQSHDAWSIEHIVPQSKAPEGAKWDCPVFSIGNLTLLNDGPNSSIGNGGLRDKEEIIKSSSVPRDPNLLAWFDIDLDPNCDSDAFSLIEARSKLLADAAVDDVWVLG
jgi:uncharacterized protein with ParB-like and HNH nuclease domain